MLSKNLNIMFVLKVPLITCVKTRKIRTGYLILDEICTMPKTIPSSYDRTSIWIIQVFMAVLILIALLVSTDIMN